MCRTVHTHRKPRKINKPNLSLLSTSTATIVNAPTATGKSAPALPTNTFISIEQVTGTASIIQLRLCIRCIWRPTIGSHPDSHYCSTPILRPTIRMPSRPRHFRPFALRCPIGTVLTHAGMLILRPMIDTTYPDWQHSGHTSIKPAIRMFGNSKSCSGVFIMLLFVETTSGRSRRVNNGYLFI